MANDPVLGALRHGQPGARLHQRHGRAVEPFAWKGPADAPTDAEVRALAGADADEAVEQTTLEKFCYTVPSEDRKKVRKLAQTLQQLSGDQGLPGGG